MSTHTDIVTAYMDAFERLDHAAVLALLTDDVVWDIYGFTHVEGKEAFDGQIENEGFEGAPALTLRPFIEDGDVVVAPHTGVTRFKGGGEMRFVACDLFTFRGDLISHVESYVVPENPPTQP